MLTRLLFDPFVTLVVTAGPLSIAPLFPGLTGAPEARQRRAVAVGGPVIAFGILTLFALTGATVLDARGIGIDAFRVAGGLPPFFTAFEMIVRSAIRTLASGFPSWLVALGGLVQLMPTPCFPPVSNRAILGGRAVHRERLSTIFDGLGGFDMAQQPPVTKADVHTFRRDGVVLLRGLFGDFVETLRAGVERNLAEPGEHAADNLADGEHGRFFEDYCNWTRIAEFERVVRESPAAAAAAAITGSERVQLFHEHVLVKEPGTAKPTPWHQDAPYYFVDGRQNVSFWVPLDPVEEATLRCVPGSHHWEKPVLPTRWLSESSFYPDADAYRPVPDPDAEGMEIREWTMAPGDAIAFHFDTLHGARGNESGCRRRAFSLRFVGDDARYVERPGPTSPPFPGHGMRAGERLREDWFPIVHGT